MNHRSLPSCVFSRERLWTRQRFGGRRQPAGRTTVTVTEPSVTEPSPPCIPCIPRRVALKLHRAVVPRLLTIKGHSLIVQLGLVIPAIKSSRWYRSPTQAIRTHLPSCRCREVRRAVCGDDSLAARPPGYGGVNHTRDLILSSSLLSYFQLRGDGVFRIRLGEPGCVWFT